ncbi:MAG TPA: response regulator [Gemmatimonadaceae bacterium]|nr:response regulator [Gemmatimonadaceae bacterium]
MHVDTSLTACGPLIDSEHTSDRRVPRAARDLVLIESDVEFADMISLALTSAGYGVQVHHSGTEGLEALLAISTDGLQRLVLVAVDLPGLDGHTLHEQIVLARPGAFIFAFLSARGGDADQIRAYTTGALDYMVKPVSLPVLIAKVRVWLNLRSRKE